MLILTETTDNLQIVLGGNVTANQLPCISSWRDITTSAFTPGRTLVNTNNITDVNIVPAPGASTQRVIDTVSVYNADTASAAVTIKLDANGTEYKLLTWVLLAGERIEYSDKLGFVKYNSLGAMYQSTLASLVSQDNLGISGSKAETMPRHLCPEVNTTIATTGQVYIQAIWLNAGTVCTNISICSATTAANTPTHYCFALYNSSRNLLASTADQTSTAWGANTVKTISLTSPYTITVSGVYYIAFMMTATAVCTVKGNTARVNGNLSFTAPIISGVSSTAYSTGTAPASLGAPAAAVLTSMWAAIT